MGIVGAVLGDIAGSQHEFDRPVDLDWQHCELYTENCDFTDDSVMSLAIKSAVDNHVDYQTEMRRIGQMYPHCVIPEFANVPEAEVYRQLHPS